VDLTVTLPEKLPPRGVDVRLQFRRVPERSCVVRSSITGPANEAPVPVGTAFVYGRGPGSEAQARAFVTVHLDAATLAKCTAGQRILRLRVEEVDGVPIDDPLFLELVDRKVQAVA